MNPSATPPFLRARLRGLYVITDERMGGGHETLARAALAGGARIIQLRDKSTSLRRLLPIARVLRRLTQQHGALLIINDRIDLTLAVGANGVHLGPDDWPVSEARRVLGPHILIGASCGDEVEARRATDDGADYIGAGAIFGTATKHDAGEPIGLAGLRRILSATHLPVAAIGGVGAGNIAEVTAGGAVMACVVSAVAAAGDEAAMTRATRQLIASAWPQLATSTLDAP
jgi:thiamine-phosphate pyrophosphorylase